MGIVGDVPEGGVRITVERARDVGPPWIYRGEIVTAVSRHAVLATVSDQGEVAVDVPEDVSRALQHRLRLVLRTAWKHASADASPPPLRLARWRPSE
jgi:hypothetical protein